MAYSLYKTVTFGAAHAGLATVGYTLTGGSRVTAGVAEIGTDTGIYGATVSVADGFAGSILWDTGEGGSTVYAADEVNPPLTGLVGTPLTDIAAAVRDVDNATPAAGSLGEAVNLRATQASVNTIDDYLDTEIAAIKAKTDNLPASPAAVGSNMGTVTSVTGNVGGNVVGSVGSVTAGVTVTTVNDKTGYALSAAGVDAIWDEPKAGHATAGTYGAYLDASVSGVSTGGVSAADIATEVWSTTARTLTAGTNIVLAKGTGITGFNDLSAAQVNAEADTALADAGLTTTVTGRIDAAVSTRMASFTLPANFSSLGINASGHVSRVTLVDTTTANTDMRGTNNAALAATALSNATWTDVKAGYLDAAISSVSGGGGGSVTVAGYATGQSPADLVLSTPAYKLVTDSSGRVTGSATLLDAVPMTLTAAPTNFREWMVWLTLRFRRSRLVKATGIISVYGSNGTSVITNQVTTNDATQSTVGATE